MKLSPLLLLLSHWTVAQVKPAPKIYYFPARFESVLKADLDTSLNVSRYSLAEAKALLVQLMEVDQRYRIKDHANADRDSARYYRKKMMVNDAANQVLLTKILQKFGWPTLSKFRKVGSSTAWHIAWHGDDQYEASVFPFLKKAYEARDVEPKHYLSIKRKMDAIQRFSTP